MARPKKTAQTTATPVPPPKDARDVRHGCLSCLHFSKDARAFPCKDCEKWNYWEDACPVQDPSFPS